LRLSSIASVRASGIESPQDAMTVESSIFAVLPDARRNWAIASIFGEAERLSVAHGALLRRIRPEDNLVYLGNFLSRIPLDGPQMAESDV
jgi:hypothetical protein